MAKKKENSVRGQLEKMLVGDVLTFPIEIADSIRSDASKYGARINRTFKCVQDREKRIITVTRVRNQAKR